jgi:hypothetical protein
MREFVIDLIQESGSAFNALNPNGLPVICDYMYTSDIELGEGCLLNVDIMHHFTC